MGDDDADEALFIAWGHYDNHDRQRNDFVLCMLELS
jgi:hypothetical protein